MSALFASELLKLRTTRTGLTLIAAPDRVRLVLAKLAAHLVAGLVLGALAAGLCALIVLSVASARGAPGLASSEVAKVVAGHIVATALWAGLGVGFGALLRNQVGAIVTALAWTFAGEQLLGIVPAGIGDAVTKYGTSGASNALTLANDNAGADTLGQLPGGLLLAGYALVFLVLGTLMLRRRDVTQ